MTLIYGVKTQNGAYLATDTRLTTEMPSGLFKVEDDFAKYHAFGDYMHLVAAGDACFASFLVQKIQSSDIANVPYSNFRFCIESLIRREIGFYPYIASAPNVVFIFAGVDPSRKEELSMAKLGKYTKLMQNGTTGPVLQTISRPLLEAMVLAATEGKTGDTLELNSQYTGVFSLKISFRQEVLEVSFNEIGWGEFLMYGPDGLTYKDVPPELFVSIDIGSGQSGTTMEESLYSNSLQLMNFFHCMISQHQLPTVGGSVVTLWVTEHGARFPTGEVASVQANRRVPSNVKGVFVRYGKVCVKVGTDFRPLRFLHDFYHSGTSISSASI